MNYYIAKKIDKVFSDLIPSHKPTTTEKKSLHKRIENIYKFLNISNFEEKNLNYSTAKMIYEVIKELEATHIPLYPDEEEEIQFNIKYVYDYLCAVIGYYENKKEVNNARRIKNSKTKRCTGKKNKKA